MIALVATQSYTFVCNDAEISIALRALIMTAIWNTLSVHSDYWVVAYPVWCIY